MDPWEFEQLTERVYFRTRNTVSFNTLGPGNDDQEMQFHQAEFYKQEIRNGVQRMQSFGVSTMPLVGTHALTIQHGGQRSIGTILATEDVRYRPKGLQPGEQHGYIVDGAQKDGTGGKLRSLWKGLLGWKHYLFGHEIKIGDVQSEDADSTTTIVITAKTKITIQAPTIVLEGNVYLGSESATKKASMEGTVDSRGDTDVSGLATKVWIE